MSFRLLNALARVAITASEKILLMAMACHADNSTFRTFVGTNALQTCTGLSRRRVYELRRKLLNDGWISKIGKHPTYGTPVYEIAASKLPVDVYKRYIASSSVPNATHESATDGTAIDAVPHPIKEDDSKKKTNHVINQQQTPLLAWQAKGQNQTGKAEEELQKHKPEEKMKKENQSKKAAHKEISKAGDSKIVSAWKNAHAAAKLPVPIMSPTQCAQLSQLSKGPKAIDYTLARDVLIPTIVSEWKQFCKFAAMYGKVHVKANSPFPTSPHVGFLLKHSAVAVAYMEMKKVNEWAVGSFVEGGSKTKFGKLSSKIPKPHGWNTKQWVNHPTEEPKK